VVDIFLQTHEHFSVSVSVYLGTAINKHQIMPQKKTTLKQRREIADGIFRRTFPALKHLMPSHTLHSVSRQIHALLSQQTTFKQF